MLSNYVHICSFKEVVKMVEKYLLLLGSPDWSAVVDVAVAVAIPGLVDTIMVNVNNIREG